MKNFLYATTGIALALALAGSATPASADVDVFASISKNKDITITETITVTKDITISVASTFDSLEGGAEAQALMNVDNSRQHGERCGSWDPTDQIPEEGDAYGIHLSAIIGDDSLGGSINENTGVFGFNQDVGNMTNQGNVVSVAGIADTIEAFADAQAHADQVTTENTSTEFEELLDAVTGLPITDPNADPSSFAVNKLASITRLDQRQYRRDERQPERRQHEQPDQRRRGRDRDRGGGCPVRGQISARRPATTTSMRWRP